MKLFQLFVIVLFIFASYHISSAQDSLSINGIKIASEDSLKAREILNNEIKPTSDFWTEEHNKPGNYRATNKFIQLTTVAYPVKSPKFKTVYVDSILSYMDQVINQHPNEGVRAEFLYKALRLANGAGRNNLATQYYSILTSEYGQSHYAPRAQQFAPDRTIQVGKSIPKFNVPTLSKTTQTYSNNAFVGKIYLIDFWGTWCGPCIKEMPFLHKAFNRYQKNGFTILSIAMNDTFDAVQNFKETEWDMPWNHSFIKDDSELEKNLKAKFEVYGFPKTILVGKQGNIIATEIDLRGEKLLKTLEKVFNEK